MGEGHEGEVSPDGDWPVAAFHAFMAFLSCFINKIHGTSVIPFPQRINSKEKNMASGEFKIRFLQNIKWKREEKNRNREPHDLYKPCICCLGAEQCGLQMSKNSGTPGVGCTGEQGGASL